MSGPIRNLLQRVRENRPQRQQRRQQRRQNRREMLRSIINPLDSIGAADAYAAKPRAGGGLFRSVGAGTSNSQFRGSDANKPSQFTRVGQDKPDGPDTGKDAGSRAYSGDGIGDGTGAKSQYAPKNPTAGPKRFTPSPSTPRVMKASTPTTPPAQGERVPENDLSNTLPAPRQSSAPTGKIDFFKSAMDAINDPSVSPKDRAALLLKMGMNQNAMNAEQRLLDRLEKSENLAQQNTPENVEKLYLLGQRPLTHVALRGTGPDVSSVTPDTAIGLLTPGNADLISKKAYYVLNSQNFDPDSGNVASWRSDLASFTKDANTADGDESADAFFRKAWALASQRFAGSQNKTEIARIAEQVELTMNQAGYQITDLSGDLLQYYSDLRGPDPVSTTPPPPKGLFY